MFANVSNSGVKNSLGAISPNISKTPKTLTQLSKNNLYYAKEGEPIYQKDMDLDEDGIVSFDELKEYCQSNNVDVGQLIKNWLVYHATKDAKEAAEKIREEQEEEPEEIEDEDKDLIYAAKGEEKYEAAMDLNDDDRVTYKEYYEYCAKHFEDGKKDTQETEKEPSSSDKKAIEAYKNTEEKPSEVKIEAEA